MRRLDARERKLVALGILTAVIAVVWLGLVSPLLGGFASRAVERSELLAAYQRNQRLLDAIPVWRAEVETQRQTLAAYAVLAPTQAQATDALKQRLAKTLADHGATVGSVQPLQGALPVGWTGVRADAQLSLSQFDATLRSLETEEPHVVVEYVSVDGARAFQSGRASLLDVRLDVSAPFRLAATGRS